MAKTVPDQQLDLMYGYLKHNLTELIRNVRLMPLKDIQNMYLSNNDTDRTLTLHVGNYDFDTVEPDAYIKTKK